MRKHNGMRPQDVAVLLKIVAIKDKNWQFKDLARDLSLSGSEIFESLNRSAMGGLIDVDSRKKVHRLSLCEFLEHGLHYVFPALPTTMVNGMYTAHSHPEMQLEFPGGDSLPYVWPDPEGQVRGLAIEPLYKEQVKAARLDNDLYFMLALIDVIRVGRVREIKYAVKKLKEIIL